MKHVAIVGGLGNQMFQYSYFLVLKKKFKYIEIFFPENKWEHSGGFELERVFNITHSPSIWEKLYQKGFPFTRIFHILHKKYSGLNFRFKEEDLHPDKSFKYFYGTWQSEKYFLYPDLIRKSFKFNEKNLSVKTISIANTLRGEKLWISIHIRRGDYLSENFKNGFGNVCDLEYYKRAIDFFNKKFENPAFVFFSDDIDWVKYNFYNPAYIFVDHNIGLDSWQDMYLMSLCQHNIIANSTFSWWGAWLNQNPDKIIIAPKTWWNGIKDDVVPESWIRI